MSLTNTDLKKITNVIQASYELINARIDKMESRIENHLSEHDRRFDTIEDNIGQLSTRENEDLFAVNEDIRSMKSRLKKAGI